MKRLKPMHYVVFDGSSHFVCPSADLTDDMDVLFGSDNFREASAYADRMNLKYL
jgi:hypothetical protein